MEPINLAFRGRTRLRRIVAALALASLATVPTQVEAATAAEADRAPNKPTVVLVHGAWADSSSWAGVVRGLQADGYDVIAPANPLRSLSSDSTYLQDVLDTVEGPIVLVGHSYGAAVISNASAYDSDVQALVYINGSVPAVGEAVGPLAGPDSALSVADPSTIFNFVPGSTPPTPESDVYLKKATFLDAFATGLAPKLATTLWATQKSITLRALNEPATAAAWRRLPSWYLVGTRDLVIPPSAQHQLARKAGSTVERFNAGHLGLITKPRPVVRIIERAARATR